MRPVLSVAPVLSLGAVYVSLALLAAPAALAQTPPIPTAGAPKAAGSAEWSDLSASQRKALAPLANQWGQISEPQKRKWIVLARNFDQLSAAEQQRLQERMGEWVALSPADRARARLNFADAKQLPADERKAKWEAYNALSDEDKRRLAQRVPPRPSGAAIATRPVPEGRIARLPQARPDEKPLPRIAASPEHVDHNTLLPAPSAQ